jgi:hypothetical protein
LRAHVEKLCGEAALVSLSEGAAISQHEESARKAYQAALTVYTRDLVPEDWAAAQNNFGLALFNLAERSEGAQASQCLRQAIDAYRNALQVAAWNGPRHTWPEEARLAAQTLLEAALNGDEDAADTGIEFIVFLLMLDVVFGILEQAARKTNKLSHWFSQIFSRALPANPDRATSILIQMIKSDDYDTSETAVGLFTSVATARPQQLMDGIGALMLSEEMNYNFLFRKYPLVSLPEIC